MVQPCDRATVRRMPNSCPRAADRTRLRCLRRILAVLVLCLLALAAGCDRNVEPYEPGEEPSAPDLARIFPGPPPGSGPEGEALAGGDQPARGALPPSRTEGAGTAPVTPGAGSAPIAGRIELAEGLGGGADGAVLFVIARPQGARGGPPLAVLRIADPEFPIDFTIGPENVMIPSMRFEGAISLSARLDADGNAMTRGAGDVSSPALEPLAPGTTGVRLVLSERG